MSDGFLGRWSRRKLEVKQGKPVAPEPQPAGPAPSASDAAALPEPVPGEPVNAPVPVPTLEDVEALTAESDYARFAAPDVTAEVRNAAMKKLFADPRYNVMDGLDVYTGDYSQPDPLPAPMLRELASAKFLGLFDEEERDDAAARQARDVADNPTAQTVAQSEALPQAVPEPHADDPDLRLQQDDAAAGEDPGRGGG